MTLSKQDKEAFMAALKNGLGLTSACELLLLSPKDVSRMLEADKALYRECVEALKFSAKALLVISNTHLNSENYELWKSNNNVIHEFIPELVLWESFKKKKDVVPEDLTVAAAVYRNMGEIATACGFTKRELILYIAADTELSVYFSEKKML